MAAPVPRILEVERLGRTPYGVALSTQRDRVVRRRTGEVSDRLFLLEHEPVITMGSSASSDHIRVDSEERARLGIELHEAGRGGDVTFHGPGQLVGYPVLDLKPDRKDLHAYLRDLEEVMIRALEALGVPGGIRREGLTGVWVPEGKLAAIGVRVSSGWITSHGFALNVSTDLSFFDTIVPCGIADESVSSVAQVTGRSVAMAEAEAAVVEAFCEVFSYPDVVEV